MSDDRMMPVWARKLLARIDDLDARIDARAGRRRRDANGEAQFAGQGLSPVTASEREQRRLQRSGDSGPSYRERDRSGPFFNEDLEDGRNYISTSGQQRSMDRADALYQRTRAGVDAMEGMLRRLSRPLSIDERNAIARARTRADSVYASVGRVMPEFLPGEGPLAYRARLADGLKDLSPSLNRTHLDGLPSSAFAVLEGRIYQDALTASCDPRFFNRGELRATKRLDETGHNTTEYHGDPLGWMAPFMAPGARLRVRRQEEFGK